MCSRPLFDLWKAKEKPTSASAHGEKDLVMAEFVPDSMFKVCRRVVQRNFGKSIYMGGLLASRPQLKTY